MYPKISLQPTLHYHSRLLQPPLPPKLRLLQPRNPASHSRTPARPAAHRSLSLNRMTARVNARHRFQRKLRKFKGSCFECSCGSTAKTCILTSCASLGVLAPLLARALFFSCTVCAKSQVRPTESVVSAPKPWILPGC